MIPVCSFCSVWNGGIKISLPEWFSNNFWKIFIITAGSILTFSLVHKCYPGIFKIELYSDLVIFIRTPVCNLIFKNVETRHGAGKNILATVFDLNSSCKGLQHNSNKFKLEDYSETPQVVIRFLGVKWHCQKHLGGKFRIFKILPSRLH
jgi:hypothetical protein